MKKIIYLLIISFALYSVQTVQAQNKFEKTTKKDGVTFSYKWRPSELFKKNTPLALIIKIENKNDYSVKVSFNVNYYWGMDLKVTSNSQEATVNPKKTFTHNVKKKGFDNFTFSNENLKDNEFSFELVKIKIEKLSKK